MNIIKGKPQFISIALLILISCTNAKNNATDNDADTKVDSIKTVQKITSDTSKTKKAEYIGLGINYFFSDDTLCQMLTITQKSTHKKDNFPETISFKLTLRDLLHKYKDKTFEGTAQLFSSSESFSDYSDPKSVEYEAADYDYKTTDYQIKIRVDIEKYEAAVAAVRTKKPDVILGGFKAYMMEFPNYGVMKRGDCK